MEKLHYGKEEEMPSALELKKHEEEEGFSEVTPEKTETVLTEKNGGHQNIVARRNTKEEGKKVTPPNVKVPPNKVFGFPERYRSPTDSIMSPATRGLLARHKRSVRPIELPTYIPPKFVENTVSSTGPAPM